jgi:hypothetical protein
MQNGGNRWRLVVSTGGDALRQERLTRDLHETLRQRNDLDVGFHEDNASVDLSRKGAAAEVALWVATASVPAARVATTLIKEWTAKERHRSVKITYRGRSITISGRPDPGQERLVKEFLDTVSDGDGSAE